MGSKATDNKVAADMSPPNYRGAVQRLRTIKTKKEKIAGVNGEIADIYAKVEGHKVNKKAARIFLILDTLDASDRNDVMRSFDGLCDAAGWDTEAADLVDQAEDNVVPLRVSRPAGAGIDVDEALDSLEAEADAETTSAAVKKARRHLSGKSGKMGSDAAPADDESADSDNG